MSENNQGDTVNQQERPSEMELGWLAGIIDGEGSLILCCNTTGRSIYPELRITSTTKVIIEKCEDIIKKFGVKYRVGYYKPPQKSERVPSHYISILTAKRMKTVTETILPYLVGKIPQATIILEFCNSRIFLPYGYPYTERELQLYYEIKKYQIKKGKPSKNGIPNDYTPGWRPRYRNLQKI